MELTKIKRVNERELQFRNMLSNYRIGTPTKEDILTALDLNILKMPADKRKEIEKKSLYIFANREPMERHNYEKLKEEHNEDNPVAKIISTTIDKEGKMRKGLTKHFAADKDLPYIATICRNAKVQITGRNIEPEWGLYNGSIGTVKEIIFNQDDNPNDGDLPLYVIVHFPQYCGPSWIPNEPKYVPIPIVQRSCMHSCCKIQYLPLALAYGKTGHTFQGQTVGPNEPIESIIVQPGNRKFEGQNPGLFYTFISRATWIGTPEERWKSAIFFSSKDMNFDRLWNLCCKPSTGAEYELVQQRRIWVEHLKNNLKRKTISEEDKADLINWANQTKIDGTLLNSLIAKSNWRTTTSLNY